MLSTGNNVNGHPVYHPQLLVDLPYMFESWPNVALLQLLQERVRHVVLLLLALRICAQGFQMAKFDPFLSLDCARVEGVGAQSKERKGSNFAA